MKLKKKKENENEKKEKKKRKKFKMNNKIIERVRQKINMMKIERNQIFFLFTFIPYLKQLKNK